MKNGDLILILILTIIFSFTAHENTQLYIILIGALILLAGYSIKSVLYPLDHGKQNILSLLVTTLLTILITVVFLRFMGKTYLILMLASIVIICAPLAFLRKKPKKENDLDIYKTGDKALKEYLRTVKKKSNKKSSNDEIIVIDREYSEVKDNEKPQKDRETEETEKLPETEEQSYEVPNVAENRFLVCERCGGYYKLKEWESPEDFESCQCGGDLHYEAYKEESAADKPDERNLDNLKSERNEHENPILGNIRKVIQETDGGTIQKTEEPDPDLDPVSRQTKRFIPYDMVLTFIFAGLCFLFLSVPSFSHMGKTLGTILMVFFPGYAIVTIIYPQKDEINLWERLGLCVMISLLVTLMFAGVSHYKNITSTTPIFTIVSIMTMFLSVIAILALLKVAKEESFYGFLAKSWKKLKASTWGRGDLSGKMSLVLLILLVLSIVTTIYLITNPNPGESFTEFYILGPQGKAADYPTNITAGQNSSVIIGMVNHEHKATNYTMVVQSNGTNMTTENITLQENQKLEIPYDFIIQNSGKREVEFLLYKLPDTQNVYLSLHLWVNVTE